ncbi:hypothetical protein LDENG_00212750, partial [Lucifuga dentata]
PRNSRSSLRVGLGLLVEDLRVHLNHWSCLSSKARSDCFLKAVLSQRSRLLEEMKQTLDSLALQALVLMEHYVDVILSAVAQTDLKSVPREVLEDILTGTYLYNQTVEEQRGQHSAPQRRTLVLHQAHCSRLTSHSSNYRGPAAFPLKELMKILAIHHAEMAARHVHHWASEHSYHNNRDADSSSDVISQEMQLTCEAFSLRDCGSEWTWEQLQHTYPIFSSFCPVDPHVPFQSSSQSPYQIFSAIHVPDLSLNKHVLEKSHSALDQPGFVKLKSEDRNKDHSSQCQTSVAQSGLVQISKGLNSVQPNYSLIDHNSTQTNLGHLKIFQTVKPPSIALCQLPAFPLQGFCQQDSVELLFQVLVSSSDLLAPLVPHTPTPEAPCSTAQPPPPHTTTANIMAPHGKTDPRHLAAPIRNMADPVELNGLRTNLREQKLTGSQQEGVKQEITSRPEATFCSSVPAAGEPETEVRLAELDALQRPPSVRWLDRGQSLVYADVFGQYQTLLWTHCSRALRLQFHVPPAGNAAGSINLWDNHTRFQLLHSLIQASKIDLLSKVCVAMLEDFCLCLLVSTAHAQWDHVACRCLGSGLKDKCHTELYEDRRCGNPSCMRAGSVTTVTMQQFLQLASPLLSSLHYQQSADSMSSARSLRSDTTHDGNDTDSEEEKSII